MRKYAFFKITSWFLIIGLPYFIVTPINAQFDSEFQEDIFSEESEEGDLLDDEPIEEEPVPKIEEPSKTEREEVILEEPEAEPIPEVEESKGEESEVEEPVVGEPEVEESAVAEPMIEEPVVEEPPAEETVIPEPETAESIFEEPVKPSSTTDYSKMSMVQNAVLEGIQINKEPGESQDESIVTGYFIFRDKPTSYFYEAKRKQKLIEFEFSDVVRGSSPIPSVKEPPIQRFKIEAKKVDINKDVVGLNPEWHDVVKVTFYFDALPKITVKDEYSIISFSFKWSSKGETSAYVDEERSKAPLFIGIFGGIGAAGVTGLVLFFTKDDGEEPGPVPLADDISDKIQHPPPIQD